ncbi:Dihydrouridine synthase TIM-barrel protein yjbN [Nitrococcus mobilis Nb-231]|uniref:tRNA-dihydrouridine synthase n=2 Tax=Nitrococcus mobilis TaxID=35797 RepID=A4BQW7_9GAMM|nr:Dihydrouridine synthase TIM-barrel protein yjbN [Nitrococcus mobilis Nb-231]
MVPAQAVWHGRGERLLAYNSEEHPVAVQFGGSDPRQLAYCARMAEAYGYDEVNLNVGCPSERVQAGRFGACLMAEPNLVAELVAAMRQATTLPVTVKTRIGIDQQDDYAVLAEFVEYVANAGCRTFIVHARKAWLKGLSPKENRARPPLRYDRVWRLKRDFPELEIVLNGGMRTLEQAEGQLASVDGVMFGREAYRNPYLLAKADVWLFGDTRPVPTRHELVHAYLPYIERQLAAGARLSCMTRHLLGLYQGMPGARAWRSHLSARGPRSGAGVEVIMQALRLLPRELEGGAVFA